MTEEHVCSSIKAKEAHYGLVAPSISGQNDSLNSKWQQGDDGLVVMEAALILII